jgi:hypothetical protein
VLDMRTTISTYHLNLFAAIAKLSKMQYKSVLLVLTQKSINGKMDASIDVLD